MHSLLEFMKSDAMIGLLVSILLFALIVFFVVRRSITLSTAAILLTACGMLGLLIGHYRDIGSYVNNVHQTPQSMLETDNTFKQQLLQAVEDIRTEVSTEKANLQIVSNQVQEIMKQMDVQKQKLQQFIVETRENFSQKTEPSKESVIKETAPKTTPAEATSTQGSSLFSDDPFKDLFPTRYSNVKTKQIPLD